MCSVAIWRYGMVAALALAAPAWAQDELVGPQPVMSDAECAVWARELSFARALAEHDTVAFADHVQADAAFNSGAPQPLRGRDQIVARWAGLIAGERLKLRWYPTRVTIAGIPDIAASSGPALYESTAPDAQPHFRLGAFHSIWHRDADGVWRVLFDDGIAPQPASDAEAQAFLQAQPTRCPQG